MKTTGSCTAGRARRGGPGHPQISRVIRCHGRLSYGDPTNVASYVDRRLAVSQAVHVCELISSGFRLRVALGSRRSCGRPFSLNADSADLERT